MLIPWRVIEIGFILQNPGPKKKDLQAKNEVGCTRRLAAELGGNLSHEFQSLKAVPLARHG